MNGTPTSSAAAYRPNLAGNTTDRKPVKRPSFFAQHLPAPKTPKPAVSAPGSAVTTTIERKSNQPPTKPTAQQAAPHAFTPASTARPTVPNAKQPTAPVSNRPGATSPPLQPTAGVWPGHSTGLSEKEVSAQYDEFFVRFDNLLKRFPLVKIDAEFFQRLPVTASGKLLTDLLGSMHRVENRMTDLRAIMEAAYPPETPVPPPGVGPIDAEPAHEFVVELTLIEQWRADGRAGFVGCKDKAALEYLNQLVFTDKRYLNAVKSAFATVSPNVTPKHHLRMASMISDMLAKLLPLSSFRYYARSSPAGLKHVTVADEDGELVARTIFDDKLNYILQLMSNRMKESLPIFWESAPKEGLSRVLNEVLKKFLKEATLRTAVISSPETLSYDWTTGPTTPESTSPLSYRSDLLSP